MIGTKSFTTERRARAVLRVAFGLLLLSPYLIWLARADLAGPPSVHAWLPVFLTSVLQALSSAALAVIAGFVLFLAAQGWSGRSRTLMEMALLFPNVVPALFLALAMLSWVTPWAAFPYGLGAVIVAHVSLNAGLVAVSLDRLVQARVGGMAETAWLMGASKTQFWRRIAWPLVRVDVSCLFLFVFSICLTSFSLPLLLGGGRWATLEVAIFELIRSEGQWGTAVLLAGGQTSLLLVLALALPQGFWPNRANWKRLNFLAPRGLRWLVWAPASLIFAGWCAGLRDVPLRWPELPLVEAFLTTMALGLAVGMATLILFIWTAYVLPHARFTRFLNGYLAPSAVITGFAFLLLPGEGEAFSFLKLTCALALISYPLLYRWLVHASLKGLEEQIRMARTLGADWRMILFEIVWPQAAPALMRASGLAAVWAAGDFAVSGIVAGPLATVPLLMDELLGKYRIGEAQLLLFPLLLASLFLYGLFVGAARYVRR